MPQALEHITTSDGTRLAVQVRGNRHGGKQGSGTPLLLLPGQAGSHEWWDGIREYFEPFFTTITFDYRGCGSSDSPDGEWSTELFADDALAVLNACGYDKADVYGTSMGGRIAQMLAGRHPEAVNHLVLACTTPGGDLSTERSNAVREALSALNNRAALMEFMYTPAGRDRESNLLGDPTMTLSARRKHLRASNNHDASQVLPLITAPTLILHGDDDPMAPAINAQVLHEHIKGSQVHIRYGRHGFFDEFSDEVNEEILEFLET